MVPVLFCDHKKWQPFHGHGDCYYYHMYMCIGESLGDTYQNINKLSLVGRITNDVHFLLCAFLSSDSDFAIEHVLLLQCKNV